MRFLNRFKRKSKPTRIEGADFKLNQQVFFIARDRVNNGFIARVTTETRCWWNTSNYTYVTYHITTGGFSSVNVSETFLIEKGTDEIFDSEKDAVKSLLK